MRIILILTALIVGVAWAQTPTQEEIELYQIAKTARDPVYCYSLENSDYVQYCRVMIRDVGASCDEISSATVRAACVKKTQSANNAGE